MPMMGSLLSSKTKPPTAPALKSSILSSGADTPGSSEYAMPSPPARRLPYAPSKNPDFVALIVNSPGGTSAKENRPRSSVTRVLATPRPRNRTATREIFRPVVASTIWPLITPTRYSGVPGAVGLGGSGRMGIVRGGVVVGGVGPVGGIACWPAPTAASATNAIGASLGVMEGSRLIVDDPRVGMV